MYEHIQLPESYLDDLQRYTNVFFHHTEQPHSPAYSEKYCVLFRGVTVLSNHLNKSMQISQITTI